jgi:hypothetical protein
MAKRVRKKETLSRWRALDAVPLRNQHCSVEKTDSGQVRLSVPVRQTWLTRVARRLTSLPEYKKIELDEIGTYVWKQCDGRTNVKALIQKVSKRFKLSYREAEVSLTQYLKMLAQRNVIGLAVDGAERRKRS